MNVKHLGRLIGGLALLTPLILLGITKLLLPTLSTFLFSLQLNPPIETEFVGLSNYRRVFTLINWPHLLGSILLVTMARLIFAVVIPLLLAWLVSQLGRRWRLSLQLLLTALLLLFMFIIGSTPFNFFPIILPSRSPLSARLVDGLSMASLTCGLGLIFYWAIWRRPDRVPPLTFSEVRKSLLAVGSMGILTTIALTIPAYFFNYYLDAAGGSIGLFGDMAALASFMLGVLLPSGLLVGVLVILLRLRLVSVQPLQPSLPSRSAALPQQSKTRLLIGLVVSLLLTLGACILPALSVNQTILLFFTEVGYRQAEGQLLISRILGDLVIRPWVAVFVAAIIQLLVIYLGALSIGAIQPLGQYSQWLLLPFSPWLFAAALPLSEWLGRVTRLWSNSLDSLMGFILLPLFSVPLLFILTLFFQGQVPRWRAALAAGEQPVATFCKQLIWPSLPLAGLLLLFLVTLSWPPLAAYPGSPLHTLMLLMRATMRGFEGMITIVMLFVLPSHLFFFLALAAFQIFDLDRLVLRASDRDGE